MREFLRAEPYLTIPFHLAHDQPLPRCPPLVYFTHGCQQPYLCSWPGAAIMILALVLFEGEYLNIVAISFTALTLNE